MGNSSSDRSGGGQGERSYRDGQQGGKDARPKILMDSTEDADLFQREDAKVKRQVDTKTWFEHLNLDEQQITITHTELL